jgi:hypothetical protein
MISIGAEPIHDRAMHEDEHMQIYNHSETSLLSLSLHLIPVSRTPIDRLDKVTPRITFPTNPPFSIVVRLKFNNRSEGITLPH